MIFEWLRYACWQIRAWIMHEVCKISMNFYVWRCHDLTWHNVFNQSFICVNVNEWNETIIAKHHLIKRSRYKFLPPCTSDFPGHRIPPRSNLCTDTGPCVHPTRPGPRSGPPEVRRFRSRTRIQLPGWRHRQDKARSLESPGQSCWSRPVWSTFHRSPSRCSIYSSEHLLLSSNWLPSSIIMNTNSVWYSYSNNFETLKNIMAVWNWTYIFYWVRIRDEDRGVVR